MNSYLILKSLHLISVISWMAGLLYLPRIFVYHAESKNNEVQETFKKMERRLFLYIMNPAKEPKIRTQTPTTNHPDCQPYCSITSETGIGIMIPPNDKPIVEIAIALLRFVINHLETVLSETVCPKQIKPTLINKE